MDYICSTQPLYLPNSEVTLSNRKYQLLTGQYSKSVTSNVHELCVGTFSVGRDEKCDISIRDESVSRQHGSITVNESGLCFLTDLKSINGTQRNSLRLEANLPYELRDGDRVRFGTVACILKEKQDSDNVDTLSQLTVIEEKDQHSRPALSDVGNTAIFPNPDSTPFRQPPTKQSPQTKEINADSSSDESTNMLDDIVIDTEQVAPDLLPNASQYISRSPSPSGTTSASRSTGNRPSLELSNQLLDGIFVYETQFDEAVAIDSGQLPTLPDHVADTEPMNSPLTGLPLLTTKEANLPSSTPTPSVPMHITPTNISSSKSPKTSDSVLLVHTPLTQSKSAFSSTPLTTRPPSQMSKPLVCDSQDAGSPPVLYKSNNTSVGHSVISVAHSLDMIEESQFIANSGKFSTDSRPSVEIDLGKSSNDVNPPDCDASSVLLARTYAEVNNTSEYLSEHQLTCPTGVRKSNESVVTLDLNYTQNTEPYYSQVTPEMNTDMCADTLLTAVPRTSDDLTESTQPMCMTDAVTPHTVTRASFRRATLVDLDISLGACSLSGLGKSDVLDQKSPTGSPVYPGLVDEPVNCEIDFDQLTQPMVQAPKIDTFNTQILSDVPIVNQLGREDVEQADRPSPQNKQPDSPTVDELFTKSIPADIRTPPTSAIQAHLRCVKSTTKVDRSRRNAWAKEPRVSSMRLSSSIGVIQFRRRGRKQPQRLSDSLNSSESQELSILDVENTPNNFGRPSGMGLVRRASHCFHTEQFQLRSAGRPNQSTSKLFNKHHTETSVLRIPSPVKVIDSILCEEPSLLESPSVELKPSMKKHATKKLQPKPKGKPRKSTSKLINKENADSHVLRISSPVRVTDSLLSDEPSQLESPFDGVKHVEELVIDEFCTVPQTSLDKSSSKIKLVKPNDIGAPSRKSSAGFEYSPPHVVHERKSPNSGSTVSTPIVRRSMRLSRTHIDSPKSITQHTRPCEPARQESAFEAEQPKRPRRQPSTRSLPTSPKRRSRRLTDKPKKSYISQLEIVPESVHFANISKKSNLTDQKAVRRFTSEKSSPVLPLQNTGINTDKNAPTSKELVLFSGVSSDPFKRVLVKINATETEDVLRASLLVTDQWKRTRKMLYARARGIPVISPDWLNACKRCRSDHHPDPLKFQLPFQTSDESSRRTRCRASLLKNTQPSLNNVTIVVEPMSDWQVACTPSVQPPENDLKSLSEILGAHWLNEDDLIVAMDERATHTVIITTVDEWQSAQSHNARKPSVFTKAMRAFPCVCVDWFLQLVMNQKCPDWPIKESAYLFN